MAKAVACRCAAPWLEALGGADYVDCSPPDCLRHALAVANLLISGEYEGEDVLGESLRRIYKALDVFAPGMGVEERYLVARIVHAAGDLSLLPDVYMSKGVASLLLERLSRRCEVITDVRATAASIYAPCRTIVALDYAGDGGRKVESGFEELGRRGLLDDAIVAIGNAPSAVKPLLRYRPAAVIATMPGFLNAAAAKQAVIESGIPAIVVRGTRGGSALAAAVVNAAALWRR